MSEQVVDAMSLCSYFVEVYGGERRLGTATAFGYSTTKDDLRSDWLVTNWHVVTGRHPETGKSEGMPTHLKVSAHSLTQRGYVCHTGTRTVEVPLMDRDTSQPSWREHPDFADVVCLPLRTEKPMEIITATSTDDGREERSVESLGTVPVNYGILPINDFEDKGWTPAVGAQVFVVGFPFGDEAPTRPAPIWKAATVASEINWGWRRTGEGTATMGSNPSFYIDTASRPGMSGSPVIERCQGEGGDVITRWVGVYSGRYPRRNYLPSLEDMDDIQSIIKHVYREVFDAQLGIVWPASLVPEIIEDGQPGSSTPPDKR